MDVDTDRNPIILQIMLPKISLFGEKLKFNPLHSYVKCNCTPKFSYFSNIKS